MPAADPTSPRALAHPLTSPADLDPLLERIGDARIVLLGEASHGTHEYYRWRAAITRRLITERGFDLVVVEGDWPDCAAVDAWVRHRDPSDQRGAEAVLGAFDRWPAWMWANREIAELLTWLRRRNAERTAGGQARFAGFDVYSLWSSMAAVVDYLEEHEPEAAETARAAVRCFEPYRDDPQSYALATRMVPTSCEDEVVRVLARLCEEGLDDGGTADERFDAEQNAAVLRDAERYYRAMVRGGPDSWNVRDTAMADTLDRLLDHAGPGSKAVVWAHNTHVGDARATDMADDGLVNVGQLARQRHGREAVVAVGFGSHRGSVVAGSAWGAPWRRMDVPDARRGSVEDLLHRELGDDALLLWSAPRGWLADTLAHRAIGVVYHPDRERWGNYVPSVLGQRYDAFCYLDRTAALQPLHPEPPADDELHTWPFGR